MGGLSKKASVVARLTKELSGPFLLIDGGSLLFKTKLIAKAQEKQAKITAAAIVEVYNLIGYDAVGISSQDLAAGLDFLLKIKRNSDFSWLSANIVRKNNGSLLFKPTIYREIADTRIAVTALTDQLPANSTQLDENTEIRKWQDVLPEIIPDLTSNSDFIILLTSLSTRECRAIAATYPAINLIIHAENNSSRQLPINLTSTTAMVTTVHRGKYIGLMNINWYRGRNWQEAGNKELLLTAQTPLEGSPSRDHYAYQTEQGKQPEKKSPEPETSRRSSYLNKFMAMNPSLPDHPAVVKIVNEAKLMINKKNGESASQPEQRKDPDNPFIGWEKCRKCHRDQVQTWQKTRHASSFLTLIEKGQQDNLNCLPCHVTGVDSNDPVAAFGMTAALQVVGCESCHGQGGAHSEEPRANQQKKVTREVCLTCHVAEHDSSFDFARDVTRIQCGR